MNDHTLFLGKFFKQGTAIASVAPSSRWLARLTVRNIDWRQTDTVVELGAGTGPITRVIAARVQPSTRVVVVERDPDFARLLRQRFHDRANFEIVLGDVRDLEAILRDLGINSVDYVVSGLPVPSFPKSLQADLFRVVGAVLRPAGTYNQITEIPWLYWRFYRRFFREVRFVFEPRNLPPAGAYFCQGIKISGSTPLPQPKLDALMTKQSRWTESYSSETAMEVKEGSTTAWSRLAGTTAARDMVNLGFHLNARLRCQELARARPVRIQEQALTRLVRNAATTRFGRDHRFDQIRSVADFQREVPLRTYEDLWDTYLRDHYPVFDNLTWPGRIPFLAMTSGTTRGATKFIPVSAEMVASNQKAARTMLAFHMAAQPDSKLFHGRLCFLGGTTDLEQPAPGVLQGDLSGIAAVGVSALLRPYTFPPLELALETDWDCKLSRLTLASRSERITLVSGVPSWLLSFFQRLLEETGRKTVAEVWPHLEIVVHGGVKFDPYRERFRSVLGSSAIRLQEAYPSSEGFIAFGDPATGLLRLVHDHGVFYEFVPVGELDSPRPSRLWLGTAQCGVNYAIVVSTCAGLWAHVIGDTVRFESLDPPFISFTGRTRYTLSAFGEHLINEEVEGAMTQAASATGAGLRDWHVGPLFMGELGYHQFVVEFLENSAKLADFRDALDADLARRNADYRAHRAPGVGLPSPSVIVARPGSFQAWMRRRGKLGGQNKVPRMDDSGALTRELVDFLRESDRVASEIEPRQPQDRQAPARQVSDAGP